MNRRARWAWTALGWICCLIAYFFLPPAGASLEDSQIPRNVDYVFGLDDAAPQTWLPNPAYLVVWMLVLGCVSFVTHLALQRWADPPPMVVVVRSALKPLTTAVS